jgi:ankyrin repeat protein
MMHVACFDGDKNTADELLHFEVDPCASDERGHTAVQIAAAQDQDEILDLFVAAGRPADVAAKVWAAKEVVLHAAASEGNVRCVPCRAGRSDGQTGASAVWEASIVSWWLCGCCRCCRRRCCCR